MRDETVGPAETSAPDPALALAPYLSTENDVLRSGALSALVALAGGAAAPHLRQAMLDPDPDIRSDAMEAFAAIATPEDAEAIRTSLTGDPVREVKLAAIGALARLGDGASVGLLRALVTGRAEDQVAWEDEGGDWDDWLDVQIAAIRALGRMGVSEAIEDMVAARADEFGQSLDTEVFSAFAALGPPGLAALVQVIEAEGGLAASRAAEGLLQAAPEMLRPYRERLVAMDHPGLRRAALALWPADAEELAIRARTDPAADVRIAALQRAAAAQPDLPRLTLEDPDPTVQAAALDRLPPIDPADAAIADNLLAWIEHAAPPLMCAACRRLTEVAPDRAALLLAALARDPARPLEARVEAVRVLDGLLPEPATDALAELLSSAATQVRTAALVALAARGATAEGPFAAAIEGRFLPDDDAVIRRDPQGSADDLAAAKDEDAGPRQIRITRDGDIVEQSEGAERETSTLAAIQEAMHAPAPRLAEDTPEEAAPKRRKRRPVEGPDEVAAALALEAARLAPRAAGAALEAALLRRSDDPDLAMRRAVWQALAARAEGRSVPVEVSTAAQDALADEDPVVRISALAVAGPLGPERLAQALADPDPLIRAEAVRRMREVDLRHLGDTAGAVRSAVIDRLGAAPTPGRIVTVLDTLLLAQHGDTLADFLARAGGALPAALSRLRAPELDPRHALLIMRACRALAGRV